MKTLLIACICSVALVTGLRAQSPTVPAGSPATMASPAASVSPAVSPESDTLADRLHKRVDKKFKQKKGIHFTIGDEDDEKDKDKDKEKVDIVSGPDHDDIPEIVLPIVVVSLLTIFGAPVLIVGLIMYFGFSRNRAMHRTVRMMVEKGQPVPEALLNPPPQVRKRSDMRRGVILIMIGLGMMGFFAAVNDWEGGAWALGIIPFLIGAGYLLVWKLEGPVDNEGRDKPPPVP